MRCSKSCYLYNLELADLFDNEVIEQVYSLRTIAAVYGSSMIRFCSNRTPKSCAMPSGDAAAPSTKNTGFCNAPPSVKQCSVPAALNNKNHVPSVQSSVYPNACPYCFSVSDNAPASLFTAYQLPLQSPDAATAASSAGKNAAACAMRPAFPILNTSNRFRNAISPRVYASSPA